MSRFRLTVPLFVLIFSVFPLTDTDIWWHLACAREWVTTWTPVREPVVNVHEFFQKFVAFVYDLGGAPLLVAVKSVLWAGVFTLFLKGTAVNWRRSVLCILLIFVFRYQLEMRPVVLSLLFLGIYWNVLPWLAKGYDDSQKHWIATIGILCIQWVWCRCQGLYILGPIFALTVVAAYFDWNNLNRLALLALFVLALFGMPFLHNDGFLLAAYPFELLNRLVGLSSSASIFAKEVAENRSPLTLLVEGENFWTSLLMIACCLMGLGFALKQFANMIKVKALRNGDQFLELAVLCTTAILALLAERNFVLFLPVFLYFVGHLENLVFSNVVIPGGDPESSVLKIFAIVVVMFVLGLWGKSLLAYDKTMISYQRVPVAAAEWMKNHPHEGRLFNDDRAGGYLAFTNPTDSTYIDGRFMLKTADFFEQYLQFAENPEGFVRYADSTGIDRAVLPLKYYARWDALILKLIEYGQWTVSYMDDCFVILDNKR